MNNFIFTLLDTTQHFDDRVVAQGARGWSIGFTRFKYDGDIIESTDPDELLQQAVATGARYCLFLTYGSFISEVWAPAQADNQPSDQVSNSDGGVLESLARWIDHQDFSVAGKFPENGSGLPDFLFIDLHRACQQGTPSFDILRTWGVENPLPAKLSNQIVSFDSSKQDTGLITRLKELTANLRKAVFVWNIESYDDIQSPAPTFRGPLSSLYTVAAGFKPNRILETHGFNPDTRMVIFDYSRQGLEHRRLMHDEWNGEDYPGYLHHRFRTTGHKDTHYLLWHGATTENLDWSLMELRWQQELDVWGGALAFKHHWQRFQALEFEYLHCDLLQTPEEILRRIRNQPGSLIWWSNAFLTLDSIRRYTTDQRKSIFRSWIGNLALMAPQLHLYGSDCNNLSVNGFTALDYAGWLSAAVDDPLDELTPRSLNRVSMRY